MTASRRQKSTGHRRGLLRRWAALFAIAGIIGLFLVASVVVEKVYAGKILPGIRVGREDLGGLTYQVALKQVSSKMSALDNEGIALRHEDQDIVLEFTVADPSGLGLTADVLEYDAEASVQAAFNIGRSGSRATAAVSSLKSLAFGQTISPVVKIDQAALDRALAAVLRQYETPSQAVGFELRAKNDISVRAPKSGKVFDRRQIAGVVQRRITDVAREAVPVSLVDDTPDVTAAEAERLLPAVRKFVQSGPLTLSSDKKKITVQAVKHVLWMQPIREDKGLILGASAETVSDYLKELSPDVSTLPKEAKFQIKDGKVIKLSASSPGSELDVAATVARISQAFGNDDHEVELVMKPAQPQANEENISNLGIVELVAEGRTNFAGSPANRRYNIAIAANLLNGLLIRPDEEFSLIKAVGPVDATLGYRQELVIKGDRTIPEFGGGLCQIGTTMFRLVLNAGLPILERRNHSYRVRYYEPPVGMDATIYEPKPDFRFKNDYAGYLLLQTRIEGDNLIFEFWGKKDGRAASTTTPRVYNFVPAPEQLTIETTDLAPGAVRCTEKAHVGSDAEFTYTVIYPDGRKVDQVFKSHYKPWRAVCFVGVKPSEAGSGSAGEVKKKTTDDQTKTNTNTNGQPSNINSVSNTNAPGN